MHCVLRYFSSLHRKLTYISCLMCCLLVNVHFSCFSINLENICFHLYACSRLLRVSQGLRFTHTHTHTEASGLLSCTQFNRHSHTLAALLRLAHSYQLLKNVRLQEREVSRIKSSTKHPLLASLLSPSDKGCAQNHPSRVFPARDGLYLCSSSSKPLRSHCVIYLQAVYER